jgi:guanylate kinase
MPRPAKTKTLRDPAAAKANPVKPAAVPRTAIAHAPKAAAPVLLVLAGPAGSGKTTLCNRMVEEVPGFERVITATTRPPRPGETDGVDYHFLSAEQFGAKVAAGEFLEWAWVHQKNRYGTLASSVLDPLAAGRSLMINVDVQGVENFRQAARANPLLDRHMATVFIEVPLPVLRERMEKRGQDSEAEIARRLGTAERELLEVGKFDFKITSRSKDKDFNALLAIWRKAAARVERAMAEQ